ncbi:Ger(x)C family spore germination protein [Paenibacillus puerhi]|uniref:Ger(x)C family spore germination protein n=1 Tax=Paenibacillus puerhi TaxID=2692622 RepID=UPI0013568006|nr:Ger(x)C family spore germination protein [Paenibacillus puerhi]
MNTWIRMLAICLLLAGAGCKDSKPIQNLAYVTAIGLDYKDGHFIAYAQILNFVNVAKMEAVETGKNVPVWIGTGRGRTMNEALNILSATSQIRMFWGHVRAIVITEELLKLQPRIKEAYEAINRYREVRYNIMLYATKDSMIDVLKQKSLLNLSPLDTILDTPEQLYVQRSYITPQYGFKFIAELNEEGVTATMPDLTITKKYWREDEKPKPMFQTNGAYFIRENKSVQWFSERDLEGKRWVQDNNMRSLIIVPNDQHPKASLIIQKPRYRIRPVVVNNQARFDIEVKAKAYVQAIIEESTIPELKQLTEKTMAEQIMNTYLKGMSTQTDVYNLYGVLYRKDSKTWHRLKSQELLVLNKDTIGKIKVEVTMTNTGKYKGYRESPG